MDRDVHDIYDVILKIIISVYGTLFLNYIGIEDEIKEILNVEFTTLTGKKGYLDFFVSFEKWQSLPYRVSISKSGT